MPNNIHTYPHELSLKADPPIVCSIDIHYEYIAGQECVYCNRWEDSIPGIAPEIILRSIQVRKLTEHKVKQLLHVPKEMKLLNKTLLRQVQYELYDDSQLTLALIDYARGGPYE